MFKKETAAGFPASSAMWRSANKGNGRILEGLVRTFSIVVSPIFTNRTAKMSNTDQHEVVGAFPFRRSGRADGSVLPG